MGCIGLTNINTRGAFTGLLHGIPSKVRATMQHLHCSCVTLQSLMSKLLYMSSEI